VIPYLPFGLVSQDPGFAKEHRIRRKHDREVQGPLQVDSGLLNVPVPKKGSPIVFEVEDVVWIQGHSPSKVVGRVPPSNSSHDGGGKEPGDTAFKTTQVEDLEVEHPQHVVGSGVIGVGSEYPVGGTPDRSGQSEDLSWPRFLLRPAPQVRCPPVEGDQVLGSERLGPKGELLSSPVPLLAGFPLILEDPQDQTSPRCSPEGLEIPRVSVQDVLVDGQSFGGAMGLQEEAVRPGQNRVLEDRRGQKEDQGEDGHESGELLLVMDLEAG
jgi:hypothetical protein